MDTKNPILFTDFPKVSTKEWEDVINADLKGADYEKKLIWNTIEGFKVKPYYRSEDLENISFLKANPDDAPFIRGNKKEFRILFEFENRL